MPALDHVVGVVEIGHAEDEVCADELYMISITL